MEKLTTKEEIILEFIKDKNNLRNIIWDRFVEKSDEIRQIICELSDPDQAYFYALRIDQEPRDDTRGVACKDENVAYLYAKFVDKSPRDDTRRSACISSEAAYFYARAIDRSPREDTRQAASKDSLWEEEYEKWEKSLKKM